MAFWQWSTTAGNNASVDPTINMAEGMPPAQLNDGVRAVMAALAAYRNDQAGALITAGSNVAYTISSNQGFTSLTALSGMKLKIQFNADCGASPTINVDGQGSLPLFFATGYQVTTGAIKAGSIWDVTFIGSPASAAVLTGGIAPLVLPIGSVIDYSGFSAPPLWVFGAGQTLNTTTYAALFNLYGYYYGGSGVNFNVPDYRGRTTVGLDNMGGSAAGRIGTALVTDGGTINGQTLGSAGGSQQHTQVAGEVGNHNHPASSTDSGHGHTATPTSGNGTVVTFGSGSTTSPGGGTTVDYGDTITIGTGHANISTTVNNNSGGAAMAWLQPSIMTNKIIFAGV